MIIKYLDCCVLIKDPKGYFYEWFYKVKRVSQNFESESEAEKAYYDGSVVWV